MTEYSFRDSPGYWHDKYEKLKAENARLWRLQEATRYNVEAGEREIARLREAPCDLHTELREENAKLRKELERSRQDDSEWKATIDRTNAENAKLREERDHNELRGLEYKAQCDTLLAALREIGLDYHRCCTKQTTCDHAIARAAIAEVEGETA